MFLPSDEKDILIGSFSIIKFNFQVFEVTISWVPKHLILSKNKSTFFLVKLL